MHNEVTSAIRAACSYLKVYPNGELRILGNVPEMHPLVGEALNLKTYSSRPYIGPLHELEKLNHNDWSPETAIEIVEIQLQNIALGMSNVDSDFMLNMHPDHFLRKQIKVKKLPNLELTYPNKYSENHKRAMAKIDKRLSQLNRYGIPSVMEVDSFFECFDYFKAEKDLFLEISNASGNLIAYDDYLFPILYMLCNKKLGNHHVTREVLRRPSIWNFRAPLLHQLRD